MITASELRAKARATLQNNWGMAILVTLVAGIIIGIPGSLNMNISLTNYRNSTSNSGVSLLLSIATLLLEGPIMLGMALFYIGLARKYPVKFEIMFRGFVYYGKSFLLGLLIAIFTFLWMLLLVIPGIIKAYSYSMGFYIMADNPNINSSDAIKQSMYLMNGNKMRLFCLDLSFIGWFILACLTCGIGFLWLSPYMQEAHVQFYEDLLMKQAAANQTNVNFNNQTNLNNNPQM